jgi:amino acid transporter
LFSTIGVILGTILPGLLIIGLGLSWILGGHPIQISMSVKDLIPHPESFDNLSFLAGMFLAFAGLEVTAAHAGDVIDPQKNYPRSIGLAALITLFLFMLGSLAIAVVIPRSEISLVAGLMDAFKMFFNSYGLGWILPVMGGLLIIGAIAEVNAWIIGPIKGLYATSIHGNLPPVFQNLNKHGMPTHLLLFQAIIVTVTSFVILQMPTISASYWILSALSAQSYLVMYIVMFISAIKLRYTKPHVPRAYKIPYPHRGIWLACALGILSSLFGIVIGFVPPSQLQTGSLLFYELFLFGGLFVMCVLPLIIHRYRRPEWTQKNISYE